MNVDVSERDLLDHVVTLALGVLLWVVESTNPTSTIVFDPTWTVVGVATGLLLFAVTTFSATGRGFRRGLREWDPRSLVVLAVGIFLLLWLLVELDVTFRPAHYSWFLGIGLSQLLGIGRYLRQRSAG